jgi:hypothetical protein
VNQRISANEAGRRRRNGKANFTRLQARIRQAIEARQSLRLIHEEHREALGVGYVQFTRYVARYLQEACDEVPKTLPLGAASSPPPARPLSPGARAEPKRAAPERRRAFIVDPMAMHGKDLI